jgi:hypothetical protein
MEAGGSHPREEELLGLAEADLNIPNRPLVEGLEDGIDPMTRGPLVEDLVGTITLVGTLTRGPLVEDLVGILTMVGT